MRASSLLRATTAARVVSCGFSNGAGRIFSVKDKTVNTGQRALLRVVRTCTKESRRAELLGQRRYAREIRGGARRALAEAAAEESDHLVRAVKCVKDAVDLAEDLPDRDSDTDGHDECIKTMHGHVQSARSYLEQHLNPAGLPKSRRLRAGKTKPSGPTGPSGTDNDVSYDVVSDSNLLRALDSLQKADVESDRLADLLDGDEGERDKSAADLHFHTKTCDDCLQNYRDSVVNNPEAEKRRSVARAWAQTIATGLH
jgi:hypothetical protein